MVAAVLWLATVFDEAATAHEVGDGHEAEGEDDDRAQGLDQGEAGLALVPRAPLARGSRFDSRSSCRFHGGLSGLGQRRGRRLSP